MFYLIWMIRKVQQKTNIPNFIELLIIEIILIYS